MRVKTS